MTDGTAASRRHKKLVVCCDGTWNDPDQDHPTNVLKTVRALASEDRHGHPQIVYYDEGVGAAGGRLRRIVDGALGIGLSQNVQDAYRFLADNYADGDEIYLFGFSRGAYTVRSLAGLLGRVRLLHKGDMENFQAAYALYRMPRKDAPREGKAEDVETSRRLEAAYREAKRAFMNKLVASSREGEPPHPDRRRFPLIRFIGVWDTVGSLGIPAGDIPGLGRFQPTFHDTELNCFVEHAYQALAIDERRKTFQPAIWTKRTDATPPENEAAEWGGPETRAWVRPENQVVEQRWFPGAHSNVGGGYPDARLSDIAWSWMIDKAEALGLAFERDYVEERRADAGPVYLEDSWNRMPWRLMGRAVRTVCEHDPSERLHHSVRSRHEGGPDLVEPHPYAPENLRALLGDPFEKWADWADDPPPARRPPAPPASPPPTA